MQKQKYTFSSFKTSACLLFATIFASFGQAQKLEQEQLKYPRPREAKAETAANIKTLLKQAGFDSPPELFIRIFKEENRLEVWGKGNANEGFKRIKDYEICYMSGKEGPKREQGDLQVPEGLYTLNHFNPSSTFHLSMKISYPNASDRILGKKGKLGGDIYIHGDCVSIGCVSITTPVIKELYWMCVQSQSAKGKSINVYSFPVDFSDPAAYNQLKKANASDASLLSFWENLKQVNDRFERDKKLPSYSVDAKGRYVVK